MEYPQINKLSGTDANDLLRDYQAAQLALEAAIKALAGVWPEARDYQGGSIQQAVHQHVERCKLLRSVALELQLIVDAILHQTG